MALIKNKVFYTYRDVTILPNIISDIEHRSECNPLDSNNMLPLFTAPMDTVINAKNFNDFLNERINPILPRTVELSIRVDFSMNGHWSAYSLKEFENIFCDENSKLKSTNKMYALIDVANGHMKKIFDLVEASKSIYGDSLILMVGNIANPKTYKAYADVGVDYVRCGIGSGFGCLSTSNTGIHMPMASLISEIAEIKNELKSSNYLKDKGIKLPKIVADGGIRNYSDIIKALALGADYVMCGSIFSKMLESAAPKTANSEEWLNLPNMNVTINDLTDVHRTNNGWYGSYKGEEIFLGDIKATFYGMASREGQIALNGSKTKTSEGIKKTLYVEYTMKGWCENFADYLRSAMSYIGARTIDEFREIAEVIVNSTNAVDCVNK